MTGSRDGLSTARNPLMIPALSGARADGENAMLLFYLPLIIFSGTMHLMLDGMTAPVRIAQKPKSRFD
jgi:hypothetical protein